MRETSKPITSERETADLPGRADCAALPAEPVIFQTRA
jgi:hypothetical protein